MRVCRLLRAYARRFGSTDPLVFKEADDITGRAKGTMVPRKPGVYLIWGERRAEKRLMYIGKSGTLKNDGQLKGQTLLTRLTRGKQQGMQRAQFLEMSMKQSDLESLSIQWFVTFEGLRKTIPGAAEAELL